MIRGGRRTPKSERRMGMVGREGPALATGGAESSQDDEMCCVNAPSVGKISSFLILHWLFVNHRAQTVVLREAALDHDTSPIPWLGQRRVEFTDH